MTRKNEQSKLSLGALSLNELTMYKIAIGLNLHVCVKGSRMGIDKVEHKSLPFLCFRNKSFQDFELGTNMPSCHYIIESNRQPIKRS